MSICCMANKARTITKFHNKNSEKREHQSRTAVAAVTSHTLVMYGQSGGMPVNILTLKFLVVPFFCKVAGIWCVIK